MFPALGIYALGPRDTQGVCGKGGSCSWYLAWQGADQRLFRCRKCGRSVAARDPSAAKLTVPNMIEGLEDAQSQS